MREELFIRIFFSSLKEVYSNSILKDLIDYNFTDSRGSYHDCYSDFGFRYKISFDCNKRRIRLDVLNITHNNIKLKSGNKQIELSWKDTNELKEKLISLSNLVNSTE